MPNLSQSQRSMLRLMALGVSDEDIAEELRVSFQTLQRMQRQVTARFIDREVDELTDDALFERAQRARSSLSSRGFEARFNALLSIAPEAVFLVDGKTGDILLVNDVACHTFGYSKRDLMRMKVEELIAPELEELHTSYRLGFLRSGRKRELGFHPQIVAYGKDGTAVDLDIALIATAGSNEVLAICTPKRPSGSAHQSSVSAPLQTGD